MEFLKSVTSKEALEIIRSFPVVLEVESADIEGAVGRVLGEDIIAEEDIPPFPRSLVDGFAIKAKDTYGARETTPSFLNTIGEIRVGETAQVSIHDGQCIYISTGAMIPEGADGVVMQEYARRMGEAIEITRTAHQGENICYAGEDIKKGSNVLTKGKRLSPFDLGIFSALGIARIPVYKKPRIGIVSSGDEIVEIIEKPPLGKIRDINRYTISSLLKKEGSIVTFFGIAKDNLKDISKRLIAAKESNILMVSGGSSKGERDFIIDSIEELGGEVLFHGINIKPGKPTIFGRLWGKPIFGLPGHPVSCMMVGIRFVVPLLRNLEGERFPEGLRIRGMLTTNVPSTYGVEEYVRVSASLVDGQYHVSPIFAKSSVISSLAEATGYIIVPEGREGYEKDEEVEVYTLG